MSIASCSNCGNPLRPGAKFCARCGRTVASPVQLQSAPAAPWAMEIHCPRCGATNRANAQFCARCGWTLVVLSAPGKLRPGFVPAGIAISIGAIILLCLVAGLGWYISRDKTTVAVINNTPTPIAAIISPSASIAPTLVQVTRQPLATPTRTVPPIGLRVGQTAPDFGLRDSTARLVRLSAYRGKPIIINFWASWCGYCRSEMPDLNALYKEDSARHDLVVLALNTNDSDRAAADKMIREMNLTFTVLWDESDQVSDQYDVRAFPTSFFIDRDGIIRAVKPGWMQRDEMNDKAKLIY